MTLYKPILYGFLPVDVISPVLKEDLREGRVRLSALAHKHIAQDHPEDYEFCLRYMAQAIENPTYVGQSPWQIRNFELVKCIEDYNVLIAIGIEPNEHGSYNIRSSYRITYEKVRRRLAEKHLFWPKRGSNP
jgi:hypothetical protein